jgi:large subunit ribosomal protein L23
MNINKEQAFKVLLSPRITEKASKLGADRKYAFKVASCADKSAVAKAVEFLFDVKVDNVRVCNVKSKERTFGARKGIRKGWKKAYVTLKEGYVINLGTA